jgi:voltage-gated potassium channel
MKIRVIERYQERPASVRLALQVIVGATVVTTLVGGLAVWIFDRDDYGSFGDAMWWSLQTVTTVGYGDNPPTTGVGRTIASFVLLYAVGFMAILTAAITTSFVERARRERRPDEPDLGTVLERLDQIAERLDRLEQQAPERPSSDGPP